MPAYRAVDVVGSLETERLRSASVCRPLGPQGELREAFEDMLRPRRHTEVTALETYLLHQLANRI